MTSPSPFSHTFILDKAHFNECYSQSVVNDQSFKAYFKAIVLTLFGMGLVLFSDVNAYAAWFVFSLGILEAVSIYYKQPWWVMRQMLSRASKGEVTVTVDPKGISTESFYIKSMVLWEKTTKIKKTTLGWVITHDMGNNYISDSCLSNESQQLLQEHTDLLNKQSQ